MEIFLPCSLFFLNNLKHLLSWRTQINRTILTPILVLFGFGGTIALMAGTNLFDPLIKFIHSEALTPLEAGACLMFTVLGFAACYFLLNLLCAYFVPRMDTSIKSYNSISKKQNTHTNPCAKIIEDN
jgi:hypothetical protein